MPKLSELEDSSYLVSESFGKCIVEDIKDEINIDGRDASNEKWFLPIEQKWGPDARYMLDDYIENQYDNLYEGWDEKARDCLTVENVKELQDLLNRIFVGKHVTEYWEFGEQVEIDVFPAKAGESA
jgi:hypothetical protein